MGSRYGGVKQIDGVGLHDECLLDFATYDAMKSGFGKVVFIIRKDIEEAFRERLFDRIARNFDAEYVFQQHESLLTDQQLKDSEGREKPWGTTHALWSARKALKGKKFLTINADDFYGRGAYTAAYDFLSKADSPGEHCCICYDLIKTLSPTGTVSRGICQTNEDGTLLRIDERKNIKMEDGRGYFTVDGGVSYHLIPNGALASMNLWAFSEGFIDDIEESFEKRFIEGVTNIPDTFEETISDAVQSILERGKGTVKCLPTDEQWFGMTYLEELDMVKNRLKELREEGVYVRDKW
jgi:NDP-sugar pyrophosphorylase family protein